VKKGKELRQISETLHGHTLCAARTD